MPLNQNIPNSIRSEASLAIGCSTISWRAIFAGLFVTLIVYTGLMCLGLGVGGRSLYDVIQMREGARDLGVGAALWTVVAAIIALYAGGHVSGRVAGLITTRVGRIQGLVIASVFFAVMFTQAGLALGMLGGGLSSAVSSAGSGLASSPIGQEVIEDALSDLAIRPTEYGDVVKGLAARLVRGNDEAAVRFLAQRAGLDVEAARERLSTFKAQFTDTVQQAGLTAARALRTAGWTLFVSIVLGCVAGMLGGALAANYNLRQPISAADDKALRQSFAQ